MVTRIFTKSLLGIKNNNDLKKMLQHLLEGSGKSERRTDLFKKIVFQLLIAAPNMIYRTFTRTLKGVRIREGYTINNYTTIGIDVAKNFLDICILPSGEVFHIPNTKCGFKKILKIFSQYKDIFRVVMEHTGGYQKAVAEFLIQHRYPVSVINPARARYFAKATGKRAKTDAIDAEMLALFGAYHTPPLTEPENQKIEKLRQLLHRRTQLIKMITSEKNRLEKTPCDELKKSLLHMINFLEKELEKISLIVQNTIKETPELHEKMKILQSIQWIGPECAATLVSELPELGRGGRQQISAIVGLAPINRDSGNKKGKAFIQAGRKHI